VKKINAAAMNLSLVDIMQATGPQAFVITSRKPDRYERYWQTFAFESDLVTFAKLDSAILRVPEFKFYLPNLDNATEGTIGRLIWENFLQTKKFVLSEVRSVIAEATVTSALMEKLGNAAPGSTADARQLLTDWDAVPKDFRVLLQSFEPDLLNEALAQVRDMTVAQASAALGAVAQLGHIVNVDEERRQTDERGGYAGEYRAGHYVQAGLVRCWWRNRRTAEAPETAEDFIGMRNVLYETDLRLGRHASLDDSTRSLTFDAKGRANDVLMTAALTSIGVEITSRGDAQQTDALSQIEAEHRNAARTDELVKKSK